MNGEGGTVLTSSEKVEEPVAVIATSVQTGTYSSGAKKPPGSSDSSKKHKSSKVKFICEPVFLEEIMLNVIL